MGREQVSGPLSVSVRKALRASSKDISHEAAMRLIVGLCGPCSKSLAFGIDNSGLGTAV